MTSADGTDRADGAPLQAVRGRRVVVGDAVRAATVLLDGGRISAVAPYEHALPAGTRLLQAPDTAYVVPGAVDTHVHLNEPGRTRWEGFATGTRAAALGGVTTVVDMPLNSIPATTTPAALETKRAAARDQLSVDVGFWGGAVPGNLAALEPLWEAGVFGFKCFLSPSGVDEFPPLDPAGFTAALREVARLDALLVVHAEDPAVLAAAPARPSRAYADFLASRPDEAETAAIRRVVQGARETGARVHVLHLSSARALPLIADAKAEGLAITVETCPHYLTFTAETIPDASAVHKCCPPIRDAGNREELWAALAEGVVDVVVSDHSPATAAEKLRGDGDLQLAWGGIAGLQVGFAALAHEALRRGLSMAQVSRWTAGGTADLVGLAGKGRIEVGADADLALYDTAAPLLVRAERLAHRNPHSAYDGQCLDGQVTHTLLGGHLLAGPERDRGSGPAGCRGRQLRREEARN